MRFTKKGKLIGRPPTGVGKQIVVRMQPRQLRRLDKVIRRWKTPVSRPEAVRRILDKALPKS